MALSINALINKRDFEAINTVDVKSLTKCDMIVLLNGFANHADKTAVISVLQTKTLTELLETLKLTFSTYHMGLLAYLIIVKPFPLLGRFDIEQFDLHEEITFAGNVKTLLHLADQVVSIPDTYFDKVWLLIQEIGPIKAARKHNSFSIDGL